MRQIKINWNAFLKIACEKYPEEAAAMLYATKMYSENEEWFVFPIENIADNPEDAWIPDKKEIAKLKKIAKKKELIKLGNIHSHPFPKDAKKTEEDICELVRPSELDLKYASKFSDTVRGIVLTDGSAILAMFFHDLYGNEIPIHLNSENYLLEE